MTPLSGYVLEPVRVGQSNSAYTTTPDVYISDQAAFDSAFPTDESQPRVEYHVFTLTGGKLASAQFVWTKNETLQRFDYDGADQRFKTLGGGSLIVSGTLASDSNTNRIAVPAPISSNIVQFPVRVSLGTGSGVTFPVTIVEVDSSFGTPVVGGVELSRETGNLNWNPADLVSFLGQSVRFQRQTFYTPKESSGLLGAIEEVLLLNPLPASGQYPLVRIGFGLYLTPVEVASESGFGTPATGTFEWSAATGRLNFNPLDVAANPGRGVYYDGSAYGFGVSVSPTAVGTTSSPGTVSAPEASDLFFLVSGVVQFGETTWVDTLTTPGKKGVVQVRRSDGQVRLSSPDVAAYSGLPLLAVVGDILLERGISVRLFRSLADPSASDPSIQDASSLHSSEGAVWADPIIEDPRTYLPALPVDSLPLLVEVQQGLGTFMGVLPRLDVASPPDGYGYTLDFEERKLVYGNRKSSQVITPMQPTGAVSLPDVLLHSSNLELELETFPGSSTWDPLVLDEDVRVDFLSGLLTFVETSGGLICSGSSATFSGTAFTDSALDFSASGVLPGDTLEVLSGASKGVYTVESVGTSLVTDVAGTTEGGLLYEVRRGYEVLADRFFLEVPRVDPDTKAERITLLGVASNSPRLSVNPLYSSRLRFRFGKTTYSTLVSLVSTFGTPAAGTIEILESTGELNFSASDLGDDVYQVKGLVYGTDYRVQTGLGFFDFTDRFLEKEEALITYRDSEGTLYEERATFLVRKEEAPHPTPTNTVAFNPLGRELASTPLPRVWRGGRPQDSTQVSISGSQILWIEAPKKTNALPSGPVVAPTESVLVDYYVHEAIGGEKSLSVLNPPMAEFLTQVNEGESSFTVKGDLRSYFESGRVLRLDSAQVYSLGSPTYDSGTNLTTVTLAYGSFTSDYRNPRMEVTSGPMPSNHFIADVVLVEPIPRGSKTIKLTSGDMTTWYPSGTLLSLVSGSYRDLAYVEGSTYDETLGSTTLQLADSVSRQYTTVTLSRSLRPVLKDRATEVLTSRVPALDLPYLVFRRVAGEVGEVLTKDQDYAIDESGLVKFASPLQVHEEFCLTYTGAWIVSAGQSVRASYTYTIAPNVGNGLKDQVLRADYTTFVPDSLYFRVETFTNFRGELDQQLQEAASSSSPTAGPVLENSSSPTLYEQGVKSLWFNSRRLANEDIVARSTLKAFNDSVNHLEDALQGLDGRVVGDYDGRFLFDGNIDNPARNTFSEVTNQIDDVFKISDAPYTVSGPPFVLTSVGTFQAVYQPAPTSRFYPTHRSVFNAVGAGVKTGDPIFDIGYQKVTSVNDVHRRYPWARVTKTALSGDSSIFVDNALGSTEFLRPAFGNGFFVAVEDQDGTVIVPDSAPLTLATVAATELTLAAPLAVDVPLGATVRLSSSDVAYLKSFKQSVDFGLDAERGLLTYILPFTTPFSNDPPSAGDVLDLVAGVPNPSPDPFRFPALDGATTNDDGGIGLPVLTPSRDAESGGHLTREDALIRDTTGELVVATTSSYEGVGELVSPNVVSNSAGPWPSPVPVAGDLLRILDGVNGPSDYIRVESATLATVTLADSFTLDSGFHFTLAVGASLTSGSGTFNPTNTLVDLTKDFEALSIKPGHTVVVTSVGFEQRRQVLEVVSTTELRITPTTFTGMKSYRIVDSLATYSGLEKQDLVTSVAGEVSVLSAEVTALESFYVDVFLPVQGPSTGTVSGTTLTDPGASFVTLGVVPGDYVFARSGGNSGVYTVGSVTGETSLEAVETFPVSGSLAYTVNSTTLVSSQTLQDVFQVLLGADSALSGATVFLGELGAVGVSGDTPAFAYSLTTTALESRALEVASRLSSVVTSVDSLVQVLSASDRLYDRRWSWIDARINLETGLLVKKTRAEQDQVTALEKAKKALMLLDV